MSSCSPLSTICSPSPSSSPIRQTITGAKYRGRSSAHDGSVKVCAHCHATSTPLWRRDPSTLRTLCNACGLYLQQHGKLRPKELIEADKSDDGPEIFDCDGTGPQCSHCHTRNTSVWRRSKTGEQLCNACSCLSSILIIDGVTNATTIQVVFMLGFVVGTDLCPWRGGELDLVRSILDLRTSIDCCIYYRISVLLYFYH